MSIKLDKYTPLMMYLSPASIPQIVAHIQDYLVKHPILSVETIAEIIVQSLQEHPELINGEAIPISADSAQSIKAYIDALPALDTYTKAEINALLLGKQDTLTFDQAPTPGSSNPVTSSGIIAAMSALQSALETHISAKADRASTYTKTQVDTLLEDKADADDVYTKNTMDAKLLEINTDIDNIEDDVSHQSQQILNLQAADAIVVDGDTAAQAVPAGGYAYIKNNTHGLAEGLYKARSTFPVSGQEATATVFEYVNSGGFNKLLEITTASVQMAEGITPHNTPVIRKCGRIVELDIELFNQMGTERNKLIGYVPVGYRPIGRVMTGVSVDNGSGQAIAGHALITAYFNGEIYVETTADGLIPIKLIYFTQEV